MTAPQAPSESVSVLARNEVAGDAAWLDAKQAGPYTCLSAATIRRACRFSGMKHIRIGRQNGPIRTTTEWVDAWMMRWEHVPASS